MAWKTKIDRRSKTKYYSIISKLRKEKKITKDFEILVSGLPLEDLIALKLELSTRSVSNRLYGLPIWDNMHRITQEAVLKYAVSATRTQGEAMRFLGLRYKYFNVLMRKYNIHTFFSKEEQEVL
tara:strand:- start:63 stop:434 length:372 start_codon:yes stop_codon:yes gene_type:complete